MIYLMVLFDIDLIVSLVKKKIEDFHFFFDFLK